MDYQEEEWFEFPPGSKFLFRVYTKNKFGKSDNSNQVDYVSDDALPTAKVENVAVKPADDDSGKVVVSWDVRIAFKVSLLFLHLRSECTITDLLFFNLSCKLLVPLLYHLYRFFIACALTFD